jgi:hypothetical protein
MRALMHLLWRFQRMGCHAQQRDFSLGFLFLKLFSLHFHGACLSFLYAFSLIVKNHVFVAEFVFVFVLL